MIKQGEVAFIKTTGEAVFVFDVILQGSDPLAQYNKVYVRRPIAGQNGIQHAQETFHLEELESLDEQRERFLAERKQVYEKFGTKQEQDSFSPIN
jgi:hypothetical protein